MTEERTLPVRAGVDLGGTKIQAAIVGPDGAVLGSARRATPVEGGPGSVAAAIASAAHDAARAASVALPARLGIGTPGSVDVQQGTVSGARNLSGFDGAVPLAELVARELEAEVRAPRVVLGNDVGVALDAEARLGAGADLASFVGVWWGTGVGGGVVLRGERWHGRGAAGEIGHVVVSIGGRRCPCGRRGCVEAYAGRRALEERARRLAARGTPTRLFKIAARKNRERLTSGVWARALEDGDELAGRLVDRAVRAIAAGAASAVNLLDVEGVVVGGGLGTRLGPEYAERIAAAMQPHLFRAERPPSVRVSHLGDLAGAVGAALL
ncbi:MAG: ROK family protein [Planctomycetes bacterium]|nr:ROK family protein [Planctomycetota bacterium]